MQAKTVFAQHIQAIIGVLTAICLGSFFLCRFIVLIFLHLVEEERVEYV